MEESKKGAKGIIFGRTLIVVLAFILQIAVLLICFRWLRDYVLFVYGGFILLGAGVVVHIANKRGNPDFKLVWMLPVIIMPVFGTLIYLYIETQWGTKIMHRRLLELAGQAREYVVQDPKVKQELDEKDCEMKQLTTYLYKFGNFPVYKHTSTKYFPTGESKFEEMLVQLKKAEKFIFLEYFIVEEGFMWNSILDVLKERAKAGVEVRVMYDGMCSLALLPFSYPKQLEEMGMKCKMFAPIRPLLSSHYNNRDHRKILVIDGKAAFTGGVNLADEYINKRNKYGHWKDTALLMEGAAVESFTYMFLEMWNVSEKRKEDFGKYKTPKDALQRSDGFVIPYGVTPFGEERVGNRVYLDMLNTAKDYVHIMTPYLILDYEMIMALTYAAKRGVQVVLILPHIPDKKTAFALARAHYNELMEAGVEIYEYTPGFIHAKVFISDTDEAVVGTINLDYRSLYLHFECAAYLYQNSAIQDIEDDFQETLKVCQKMKRSDYKKDSLFFRLEGKVLRLFAPLM